MDGQGMPSRLGDSVCYALLGAAFGFFSAAFVWEFMYGICFVPDDVYLELHEAVSDWGAAAGACSGFVVRLTPNPRPARSLMLLHGCGVVAGIVNWGSGWKGGLVAYFGVHVAAVVGCCAWAVVLATRKVVRRTALCPARLEEKHHGR